jgi:hypothetical protein
MLNLVLLMPTDDSIDASSLGVAIEKGLADASSTSSSKGVQVLLQGQTADQVLLLLQRGIAHTRHVIFA